MAQRADVRVFPLTPMRRAIVAQTTLALSIPHYRVAIDVEMDALIEYRTRLNEASPDNRVSLNDLYIEACAGALRQTPPVNVTWAATAIHQHAESHIAVITAVGEDELFTPVIRNAGGKSIWEIAAETRCLVAKARSRTLKVDECIGATFSISNLGMYGVDAFDALVSGPQCAILAIGAFRPTVVPAPEDGVRCCRVGRLTLSVDHRAIDGVLAARFLSRLRERLEHPDRFIPTTDSARRNPL